MTSPDTEVCALLATIEAGSGDVGRAANDLLRELQRGSPVEQLLVLLRHPDPSVVAVGAWLTSELGPNCIPIAPDVIALLRHPSRLVRMCVVDAVQAVAVGAISGDAAAAVVSLLDDDDPGIRWKSMGFLGTASTRQLDDALKVFAADSPDETTVGLLTWLLSVEARDPAQITARLAADDARVRRVAVAAAFRLVDVTRQPLDAAASAEDSDVRDRARDWLAIVDASRRTEG